MEKICRVLVVEDNDGIRDMLAYTFEHEGYRFAMASNGAEMRRALAADRDIDVVVIDVVLPGGESGLTLAQEAAAQGRGVILVTGHHDYHETVERSGHQYMFKPFRLDAFLALIDQTLKKTKAQCRVKERRYG